MGNQSSSSLPSSLSSSYEDDSFIARRQRRELSQQTATNMATTNNDNDNADPEEPSWLSMSNMEEIQRGLSLQPTAFGVQNDVDARQRSFERKQEYQRKQEQRSERLSQIKDAWYENKIKTMKNNSNYRDARSLGNAQRPDPTEGQDDDATRTLLLCGLNCC